MSTGRISLAKDNTEKTIPTKNLQPKLATQIEFSKFKTEAIGVNLLTSINEKLSFGIGSKMLSGKPSSQRELEANLHLQILLPTVANQNFSTNLMMGYSSLEKDWFGESRFGIHQKIGNNAGVEFGVAIKQFIQGSFIQTSSYLILQTNFFNVR